MRKTRIDRTRRMLLAASAAASLFPLPAFSQTRRAPARERLWYARPALRWEEALPIGNGRIGAMVFGGVAQERLQLNEDTLWSGSPYTPDNPAAFAAIPEVRRLLQAKEYEAATALASSKVMAVPLQQMSYGSAGDLFLNFASAGSPSEYVRALDLATATASTRYRTQSGDYTREAFASAPHQVIVLRLEAKSGRLGFDVSYRAPRRLKYISPSYQGAATEREPSSPPNWLVTEPSSELPPEIQLSSDGPESLLIRGRNTAGPATAAGLEFALRIRVLGDGFVSVEDGHLVVRDTRAAVLLIAVATSYKHFNDVTGDAVAKVRQHTESAARESYAALRKQHVRSYRALYASVSLELPSAAAADKPTNIRILESESSDDPALAALYFQFARYLLISSSRPGCQPANLQGIWNEGINPPWGSKYTININTQMNYWPADAAGLGVCIEPLLRMVEDLAITGALTARTMYGARGWVAHHNTDLWRAAAPIDGPLWGLWPCGGAWLCNSLWDHYDFSRDRAVLQRLYPLMRGASLFFLDTLVEDPDGRGLVTSPSLSPENKHPFGSSLCLGPAMDRQILRDLFAHTIEAAQLLAVKESLLVQMSETARRLAPDAIGQQGQLQEWLEDWDAMAPEPHHRHVSHLYAVYPSSQINVRDTPQLIDAAKQSLRLRGDLATGWGTAWRLCLWARIGESERAHRILKMLLGPYRTYPNLFDAHPPFQIDGNFGGAAGILEMIVQSWGGEIRLLPALPSAWPSGEARGLCARGGIRVSLRWRAGKLSWFELLGPAQQSVTIRYGDSVRNLNLDAQGRYRASI